MNHQVAKNLMTVYEEAMSIMTNLEQVRGARHKNVVSMLLCADKMIEVVSLLERASYDRDKVTATLRECFFRCVHDQITEALNLAGVEDVELNEAMADAERIRQSVHGLQTQAVTTGMAGEKFGDQ